jgi:sulfate/thiosulfate transport system ATP-binding protein
MSIVISGISKRFGTFAAVDAVDLSVRDGELLALLGPSGSGKTTLLRMIGGLEFADEGTLTIDGQDATTAAPHLRRVGFVFQHYALFRHMSVFENVAFGLRVARRQPKLAEAEIAARVHHLLTLVQLGTLYSRYPGQLSGGQRQRVALARALATEPRVLLLDEPFGALDAKVRKDLRRWLRNLHKEMGVTTIFVTHDQEEALELADRVAILHQGRLLQVGRPDEVYDRPASPFVCDFLGGSNRVDCDVVSGQAMLNELHLPGQQDRFPDGPATAYVRPQDIELTMDGQTGAGLAEIISSQTLGSSLRVELRIGGQSVEALLDRWRGVPDNLAPGQMFPVRVRHASVFPGRPLE